MSSSANYRTVVATFWISASVNISYCPLFQVFTFFSRQINPIHCFIFPVFLAVHGHDSCPVFKLSVPCGLCLSRWTARSKWSQRTARVEGVRDTCPPHTHRHTTPVQTTAPRQCTQSKMSLLMSYLALYQQWNTHFSCIKWEKNKVFRAAVQECGSITKRHRW